MHVLKDKLILCTRVNVGYNCFLSTIEKIPYSLRGGLVSFDQKMNFFIRVKCPSHYTRLNCKTPIIQVYFPMKKIVLLNKIFFFCFFPNSHDYSITYIILKY